MVRRVWLSSKFLSGSRQNGQSEFDPECILRSGPGTTSRILFGAGLRAPEGSPPSARPKVSAPVGDLEAFGLAGGKVGPPKADSHNTPLSFRDVTPGPFLRSAARARFTTLPPLPS
jgi:hypothetical protein